MTELLDFRVEKEKRSPCEFLGAGSDWNGGKSSLFNRVNFWWYVGAIIGVGPKFIVANRLILSQ